MVLYIWQHLRSIKPHWRHYPQYDVMEDLSAEPTLEELQQAVNTVPYNKAPGNDSIPAEIYECANQELHKNTHHVLLICWKEEDVPQDLKDARFIQLYNNMGDRSAVTVTKVSPY